MGISYRDFEREIEHAENMCLKSETDEMRSYWKYYCHGLRRLYHGEAYSSNVQHRMRLDMVKSTKQDRRRKGEGYVAGFEFDKRRGDSGKVGRKRIGDVQLPCLTVTKQLAEELQSVSLLSGEGAASIRRRILERGIMDELKRWRVS